MATDNNNSDAVEFATSLTMAWLGNPHTRPTADDVPAFLRSMFDAVSKLAGGGETAETAAPPVETFTPAVSVRKSLADPDFIISMIDGRSYKALKRHLTTNGLTPDEYRARYGLRADYPMVAPNYAAKRSETAKRLGLGRKPGQKVAKAVGATAAAPAPEPTPKKRRAPKGSGEAKAAAKAHLGQNDG